MKKPAAEQIRDLLDIVRSIAAHYEETEPNWLRITLIEHVRAALWNLRHYIGKPDSTTNWRSPHVRLAFAVDWDWEEGTGPWSFSIRETDLADREALIEKLTDGLVRHIEITALHEVADRGILRRSGGRSWAFIPNRFSAYAENEEFSDFLYQPRRTDGHVAGDYPADCPGLYLFRNAPLDLAFAVPVGRSEIRGVIETAFFPLETHVDSKTAYYPIDIRLRFRGLSTPAKSDARAQETFWDSLYEVCDRCVEAERTRQKFQILSDAAGILIDDPQLLEGLIVALNQRLRGSGNALVRVSIPGNDRVGSYLEGPALEIDDILPASSYLPLGADNTRPLRTHEEEPKPDVDTQELQKFKVDLCAVHPLTDRQAEAHALKIMGLNVSQIARYLNRHRSTVEERLRGAERIIDHSNAHKTRQRRRAIFQTDN